MIPKSGHRFSEKIMLKQQAKAKCRINLKSFRFKADNYTTSAKADNYTMPVKAIIGEADDDPTPLLRSRLGTPEIDHSTYAERPVRRRVERCNDR
jgi:hypothetical protein